MGRGHRQGRTGAHIARRAYQGAHGGNWAGAFDFVLLREYAATAGFADALQLLSFAAFFLGLAAARILKVKRQ